MENKKYLDKVIMSLVRGTNIDYDEGRIYAPFSPPHFTHYPLNYLHSQSSFFLIPSSFSKYCKNTFGLTEEEVDYVWEQYREIILSKIEDGQ